MRLAARVALVALLLAHAADVEAVAQRRTPGRLLPAAVTPLQLAAHHGHAALARALLEGGARVDAAPGGLTPLMLAARSLRARTVGLLLERGADAALAAVKDADSIYNSHGASHQAGRRAAEIAAHGAQYCRPGGEGWAQFVRIVEMLTAAGGGVEAVSAMINEAPGREDSKRVDIAGLLDCLAAMGLEGVDDAAARAALEAAGGDADQAVMALLS